MKKLATIIFLLISTSLLAGWKWVEIPTISAPILLIHDGDPEPFRAGYDPTTKSVIVNLHADNQEYQTWRFDGSHWHYVTNCLSGVTMQGDIVFHNADNELYDFIFTYILPYWTRSTIVGKWENNNWIDKGPLSGNILDATYDSVNERIILLVFGNSTNYYMVFYDSEGSDYLIIPEVIQSPAHIEYDPVNNKVVILEEIFYSGVWEYCDNSFNFIETDFPAEPNICDDVATSMVYNTHLSG
ncbi:MAG TPA: hypothetical protein PK014_06130 [Thermoanaerobaculia bacterium]|nr:hypothetical protein [Thermoanaerobaculia bacterium]HUM29331.1 hypothetical protein [Thermoanaerobaculia bacterium]HXK67577.1 hypothetical protein [Thermoanaerobaculia bacterium]